MADEEESKTCTHCGRLLPLSAFRRKAYWKQGRMSWCAECVGARAKERHATDPEYREEVKRGGARQYEGVVAGNRVIRFLEGCPSNRALYCKRCDEYYLYRLVDGQEDADTVPCPQCGRGAEVFGRTV